MSKSCSVTYWKRKGFAYYAYIHISDSNGRYNGTINKKLDFISYHLILWFHGEKKLQEMAADYSAIGDI